MAYFAAEENVFVNDPMRRSEAVLGAGIDEDYEKLQVKTQHGVSTLSSPDDLALKAISDVTREFADCLSGQASAEAIRNELIAEPIRDPISELIALLDQRAARITTDLFQFYRYAPVKKYLTTFKQLHERHIDALRVGKVILAHETLAEIHELSHDLERTEFWARHRAETPSRRYPLRADTFQHGRLICEYVAGDMTPHSNSYPSNEGYSATSLFMQNEARLPPFSAGLYLRMLDAEG